jgi:hypothetical protein
MSYQYYTKEQNKKNHWKLTTTPLWTSLTTKNTKTKLVETVQI